MSLMKKLQERRAARLARRREIDEKNTRGFEQNLELEKGDLPAIIIAGIVSFILPIMLAIGAVCGLAYLLLAGLR